MTKPLREHAELAFADLLANDEVQFIDDGGDLHIAADNWTLVLEGDPVTGTLVALEDEDGAPEIALGTAISEPAAAAMRDLDESMQGELTAILGKSPDPLAQKLSEMLRS